MIEPVAYKRKLEGKSNAHLITFNDGKDYVVKYFQEGFEKSLPNEWVAYCLARYLDLPIPFAKTITISTQFSSQIPALSEMTECKTQFASEYVPHCLDGHLVPSIQKLTNDPSQLATILLFDYWLFNTDRTKKNILLQEQAHQQYKLWVIDHAEIFGSYNWNLSAIQQLPKGIMKSATHQIIASFIDKEKYFYKQLELIQTIPILLLEEIVDLIPEDWQVTKEEKKAIVTTLLRRRKKIIPEILPLFLKKIYRPLQHDRKTR